MCQIRSTVADRAMQKECENKKASSVFTRRHDCYNILDEKEFVKSPVFSDSFNRLASSKVSTSTQVLVLLEELRRLESAVGGSLFLFGWYPPCSDMPENLALRRPIQLSTVA